MTTTIKPEVIFDHLIYESLCACGISLGLLPASPNKCLKFRYCSTPKNIPTPAAPNPQCHPIFSPKYEQIRKPNVEPIFIDI